MAQGDSPYGVHPSLAMVRNRIETLPAKTGRSLDQWLELVRTGGPPTAKERREWLKVEYKLGTNSAWWIADRVEGMGAEDDDPDAYLAAALVYVEDMVDGKRAALRPIYEALLDLGKATAPDVRACPCKTMVPLYRTHVFAQIKPATNTRIDIGFALGNRPPEGRLIDTGGFAKKDRITHRIPIAKLAEIDDEIRHWLQVSYDLDA